MMASKIDSLNGVEGSLYFPVLAHKKGWMEKEGFEKILKHIFSFLSDVDKQSTALVCKLWNRVTIRETKDRTKAFFTSFLGKVDREKHCILYTKFRAELNEFASSNWSTLLEIKKWISEKIPVWSNILKNSLAEADLIHFISDYKVWYIFKKSFLLGFMHKKIDRINRGGYQRRTGDDIVKDVVHVGHLEKLLKSGQWDAVYNDFSEKILKKGEISFFFSEAMQQEVSEILHNEVSKGFFKLSLEAIVHIKRRNRSFLKDIAGELLDKGDPEQALKAVGYISYKERDSRVPKIITDIVERLVAQRNFEKALEAANQIQFDRFTIFRRITGKIIAEEGSKKALELANNLSFEGQQTAMNAIAEELMDKEGFKKTLEFIINNLPNGAHKFFTLKGIIQKLIMEKGVEKALEIVNSLPFGQQRVSILREIAVEQADKGEFEKVLKIVNSFSFGDQRCSFLREIAVKLIDKGKFEKALELVNSLPFGQQRYSILREIAVKQAQKKEFEKALKITDHLPHGSHKFSTLIEIATKLFLSAPQENSQKTLIGKIVQELVTGEKFNKILEWMRGLPDESNKFSILQEIVQELTTQKGLKTALELANDIPNVCDKFVVIEALAQEERPARKRRKYNNLSFGFIS